MADKPSELSPYKSRFKENCWLTAAQFISETMCARLAKKRGEDLPPNYWQQPTWKRTFLIQLRLANGLLKIWDRRAVFAALRRARFVFSLNNKMVLDPILQEEQEKLNRQQAAAEATASLSPAPPPPKVTTKPREVYNPQQSTLSKLRNLDA